MSEEKESTPETSSSYAEILNIDPEEFIDNIEKEFDEKETKYEKPPTYADFQNLSEQILDMNNQFEITRRETKDTFGMIFIELNESRKERQSILELMNKINDKVDQAILKKNSRESSPMQPSNAAAKARAQQEQHDYNTARRLQESYEEDDYSDNPKFVKHVEPARSAPPEYYKPRSDPPKTVYTATAENPYAFTPLTQQPQAPRPVRRETLFSKIDEEEDSERLSFKYDQGRAMTAEQREQMRRSVVHSPRDAADAFQNVQRETMPLPPMNPRPAEARESRKRASVESNSSSSSDIHGPELRYTFSPYVQPPQAKQQPMSAGEKQYMENERGSTGAENARPMYGSAEEAKERSNAYAESQTYHSNAQSFPYGAGSASLPRMNPGGGYFPRPPMGSVPPPPPQPPNFPMHPEYANVFSGERMQQRNWNNGNIPNKEVRNTKMFGDVGMLDKISNALANPMHGTYMTQMLPSYEHIMLKTLTPRSVIGYVQLVYDYVSQYNVAFKLTSRIESTVRDCIISRNAAILDEYNFHTLTNDQLVKILQHTVRPKSKDEFIENMQKYVKFRQIGEGVPENFQNFYDALSRYRRLWVFYYEFMSENNADNVPHCNTKRNGLIHMFTSEIPSGYGQNRSNVLKQQKFNDIKHFIECFWLEVEEDYRRSKDLKILQMGFDKASPHVQPKPEDSKPKTPYTGRSSTYPKSGEQRPPFQKKSQLHATGEPPKQEESEEASPTPEKDSGAEEEETIQPPVESDDEQTLPPSNLFDDEDPDFKRNEDPEKTSGALGNIQPRPQDKYSKPQDAKGQTSTSAQAKKVTFAGDKTQAARKEGCYNMLTPKGCDKNPCPYSHAKEDLQRTWLKMSELVSNSARTYGTSKKPDERSNGGDSGGDGKK